MRAFELYEQRGKQEGFDLEDWLQDEGRDYRRTSASPGCLNAATNKPTASTIQLDDGFTLASEV